MRDRGTGMRLTERIRKLIQHQADDIGGAGRLKYRCFGPAVHGQPAVLTVFTGVAG